ncbi:hypothetical protein ASPWEDRAFT_745352 [Aspergillus wentii DTO 134E9]|uniref:RTA1 domain protein n=1 Tax=Aspergillus wentii DTO 134E9 TaxID=1073089 RepID=A0A1L9RAH9_ASPWE|nr:uncharacterized protein ASPWEDRAFT_745352 [Aspergillus wentii DTO 134E9]OJJ31908.1 hypothetical protein ASPWEDRAFT_745352 [Aspergillus wentii DTO 134E9]
MSSLYPYTPSHVLPVVFAILVGISLLLHVYQNKRYSFWRVTFFMVWGSIVYLTGWILRAIASYHPSNLNLYIAQTIFIYAGPPIYSAAAYNLVGRLMHYLPMFAPLNPNRVVYFFIYLGILAESLTAAGAARMAASDSDMSKLKSGGTLLSVAIVLQAVVESLLVAMVFSLHRRCIKMGMIPPNVRTVIYTLYGTSTFVLLRCIFRAIESFTTYTTTTCTSTCASILHHEWYIYALEAAPMVIFTYWLNLLHPGRYLPSTRERYLDVDGETERLGPGWMDRRSVWETFVDPFDLMGLMKGKSNKDEFWLRVDEWRICDDGFARGTGSNVKRGGYQKEVV